MCEKDSSPAKGYGLHVEAKSATEPRHSSTIMILGCIIVLTEIGRATLSTNSSAINPVTTKSERRHGRMAVELALTAILSLKASLAKSCCGGRSGAWNAPCSVGTSHPCRPPVDVLLLVPLVSVVACGAYFSSSFVSLEYIVSLLLSSLPTNLHHPWKFNLVLSLLRLLEVSSHPWKSRPVHGLFFL